MALAGAGAGGDAVAVPPIARAGRDPRRRAAARRVAGAALLLALRPQRRDRGALDRADHGRRLALSGRRPHALARGRRRRARALVRDEGDGVPRARERARLPRRDADGGAAPSVGRARAAPRSLRRRVVPGRVGRRGAVAAARSPAITAGLDRTTARGGPGRRAGHAHRCPSSPLAPSSCSAPPRRARSARDTG